MRRLLDFDWTLLVQLLLLQSCLHFVRHLRLFVNSCQSSFYCVQTSWVQLHSPDLIHRLILKLCKTYHALSKWGFSVILAWIPGHVGIGGATARDTTIQGTLLLGVLDLDFKKSLHQSILAKWQRDWDLPRARSCKTWNQWYSHGGLLAIPSPW
jgi:hypothetical protein